MIKMRAFYTGFAPVDFSMLIVEKAIVLLDYAGYSNNRQLTGGRCWSLFPGVRIKMDKGRMIERFGHGSQIIYGAKAYASIGYVCFAEMINGLNGYIQEEIERPNIILILRI